MLHGRRRRRWRQRMRSWARMCSCSRASWTRCALTSAGNPPRTRRAAALGVLTLSRSTPLRSMRASRMTGLLTALMPAQRPSLCPHTRRPAPLHPWCVHLSLATSLFAAFSACNMYTIRSSWNASFSDAVPLLCSFLACIFSSTDQNP